MSSDSEFIMKLRLVDSMDNCNSIAMDVVHQVGCILVYDEECGNKTDLNDDAPPSLQHSNESSCGDKSITVDWFQMILNHALVVANAAMALCLLRAINLRVVALSATERRNRKIAIPSYFACRLCFLFGK